ncbi:MAG: hypothetical protein AUJ75_00785 [Candidatus Omnitrophica bacterium CG1_02_49_10]|nr:MAG: hypothetical protein AUJ75_00785 [Candidatus Omnitrophica bacterium CG1_02_49_10]
MKNISALERRILNRIQEDLPFTPRPWRDMADELGIEEDSLLKSVAILKKKGIVRRISAVFDPRKIGSVSTLVAARVAPGNIHGAVKKINSYGEVTHNYRRAAEYNIWFTLIADNRKKITRIIDEIKGDKNIDKMTEFPAEKLYKIAVKFKA